MTQEQLFGILRSLLTIVGTYLFGHNLFGNQIDESLWQEITGGVLVLASFIWSFATKSLTLEMFQSAILKIVMIIGGLLVTSNKLSPESLQGWVGLLTIALPVVYSYLSKKKSADIASGKTDTAKLSK